MMMKIIMMITSIMMSCIIPIQRTPRTTKAPTTSSTSRARYATKKLNSLKKHQTIFPKTIATEIIYTVCKNTT